MPTPGEFLAGHGAPGGHSRRTDRLHCSICGRNVRPALGQLGRILSGYAALGIDSITLADVEKARQRI